MKEDSICYFDRILVYKTCYKQVSQNYKKLGVKGDYYSKRIKNSRFSIRPYKQKAITIARIFNNDIYSLSNNFLYPPYFHNNKENNHD